MLTVTRPALRYHGGKWKLAPWKRPSFADGARSRIEVVWLNAACTHALANARGGLFTEAA